MAAGSDEACRGASLNGASGVGVGDGKLLATSKRAERVTDGIKGVDDGAGLRGVKIEMTEQRLVWRGRLMNGCWSCRRGRWS